jgi:hypothetical protein
MIGKRGLKQMVLLGMGVLSSLSVAFHSYDECGWLHRRSRSSRGTNTENFIMFNHE